jgi:hypothetical protein
MAIAGTRPRHRRGFAASFFTRQFKADRDSANQRASGTRRMTATDGLTRGRLLLRWWRRRAALRRQVEHAVWDLRERYGDAACQIARASAKQPVGFERRRFWRKVAAKLQRFG